MRSLMFCVAFTSFTLISYAQSTGDIIKQQAGEGVKQGATVATEKAADKVTDKVLSKIFDKKKKKNTDNSTSNTSASNNAAASNSTTTTESNPQQNKTNDISDFKTYSKFDFIPGDKILAYDDFTKDAIGDFPVAWNTNSTGEVVASSASNGHWLMLSKQGKYIPEYINSLPDNFTFEYDIVANEKYNYYSPPLTVYFLTGKGGKDILNNWFLQDGNRSGVKLSVHPTGGVNGGLATIESFEDAKSVIKNDVNTTRFSTIPGKAVRSVHVSVWRQKQRIRVYLNEEKVYDLPRAFPDNKTYTTLLFAMDADCKDPDRYLLCNLKLSAGVPDTRNKLITEGKFVTRGILFDVNSDKIKPESYGVLKDIANVLTENASVKVKIVGHTDSDGKDADNLSLSKRRAESVKASLAADFGIDASRLETDGKGASQPVDTSNTPAGKANNRRVEFVKL